MHEVGIVLLASFLVLTPFAATAVYGLMCWLTGQESFLRQFVIIRRWWRAI